jgi:hypothetical protein
MVYELKPNNGRKSFYGKAHVIVNPDGSKTLFSYGTAIATLTNGGEYIRHWEGWSSTTGNHIAAFCGYNKKEYQALPYVTYKQ